MNLTLQLHPATEPPDADLDCLIWDHSDPEAQLGAYVGDGWVNAQGEAVEGVHTWAAMPCLPVRLPVPEARELGTVPLPGGGRVDLNGPWSLPR